MIKPTVGRIVLYWREDTDPGIGADGPNAAIVAHVWNDRLVNLHYIDSAGTGYSRTDVPLVQEGDQAPKCGGYCEWMPYQLAVAKGEIAPTLHATDEEKPLGDKPFSATVPKYDPPKATAKPEAKPAVMPVGKK